LRATRSKRRLAFAPGRARSSMSHHVSASERKPRRSGPCRMRRRRGVGAAAMRGGERAHEPAEGRGEPRGAAEGAAAAAACGPRPSGRGAG
jgi:hypothetical protein